MALSENGAQRFNQVGDVLVLVLGSIASTTSDLTHMHWRVAAAMAAVSLTIWYACARLLRHYDDDAGRGVRGDVVLTALLIASLLVPLLVLRLVSARYATGSDIVRFVTVVIPGVVCLRMLTNWLRRREDPPEYVIIAGIGPLGRHTFRELRDKSPNRVVTGYLRFSIETPHDRLRAPLLGSVHDLEELIKRQPIDEVYIASNRDANQLEMQSCIRVCEHYGIPFALPACRFRVMRARPMHEEAVADGYIHYASMPHKPFQLAIKRAIDIAASASALLILAPLLLVVAALIKITSRGPILFRQVRVGLHGRQFNMLKFRSMVVDAEKLMAKLAAQNEQTGPVFKMKRDPRITAVGRFIRKYSIDELPQLINVLRGDMTLVGPRPALSSEVARYEAWQRRRLSVRPGLTCVWQVSGRNDVPFEQWMYLDMQYIDHWNLAQDVGLILKTVPVVLTGRGAS
jgi:exopolysaccharide biosynthesis polyprenyl glycosylphosphotransferase